MSVYESVIGEHRISNSERVSFRRCRRQWDWQHRGKYRNRYDSKVHLWFGSGFHYALERYHGYGDDPSVAWDQFVGAHTEDELPPRPDVEESNRLAYGMLEHYTMRWLPRRSDFRTWFLDGVPQVEIEFKHYVMDCPCHTPAWPVYHVGTFDRVVVDPYGKLWVQDYKTTARFDTHKLDLDAQVTSYSLFAKKQWGLRFEGVLYTQFKKATSDYPKRLNNGSFSKDKNQNTTYAHYAQALLAEYGEVPPSYLPFLNSLAELETPNGDQFIRQDQVERNEYQLENEWQTIQDEFYDMLNSPRIYKNATKECHPKSCDFYTVCGEKDRGEDYQFTLTDEYEQPLNNRMQTWRTRLHQQQQSSTIHL